MKLLVLPGNSIRNKENAYDIGDSLRGLFDEVVVWEYAHWSSGGKMADIDKELSLIKERFGGQEFFVVAKSVGTHITLRLVSDKVLSVSKVLFLGLPLVLYKSDERTEVLIKSFPLPFTIIQNTDDPYGSVLDLKKYFSSLEVHDMKIIDQEGDTHSYEDYSLIKKAVSELL